MVVYDPVEVGTGVFGMEEAGNRRMGHSGSSEVHFGTELEVRLETLMDHSETEATARSEKEALHSGKVEDRFGMEGSHFGTEEGVRLETEIESQGRFAEETVEAAQTLDLEVDQSLAAVEEMESAAAGKAVVAERKVEERRNRTDFEA